MVLSTLAMMMFAMANACNPQCYLDNYGDLQTAFGYNSDGTAQTARSVVYARAAEHWNNNGMTEGRDCACKAGSPRTGPPGTAGTGTCYTGTLWNGVICVDVPQEESTGADCTPNDDGSGCAPNEEDSSDDDQEWGRRLSQLRRRLASSTCDPQCYLDNYLDLRNAFGYNSDGTDILTPSVVLARATNHWNERATRPNEIRDCTCKPGSPSTTENQGCSTGYIWNGVKCVKGAEKTSTGANCPKKEDGSVDLVACGLEGTGDVEDGRRLSQ